MGGAGRGYWTNHTNHRYRVWSITFLGAFALALSRQRGIDC